MANYKIKGETLTAIADQIRRITKVDDKLTTEEMVSMLSNILQQSCPLSGKKLSIIGDSISTYSGYIPEGYATFYPKGTVTGVTKTWWDKLITNTKMVLHRNASWSGSTLCGNTADTTGIIGSSDARVEALGGDDAPDIIIVFMGINDFAKDNGFSCGSYDGTEDAPEDTNIVNITDAYGVLLKKLRTRYPNAMIMGCRVMPEQYKGSTSMDASYANGFPNINPNDDVTLTEFNEKIEKICKAYGCGIIPMDLSGISFFNVDNWTVDGLHPNAQHMERMATIAEISLLTYAAQNGGNSDSSEILYKWDFTKSMTDEISNQTATLECASESYGSYAPPERDSSGVHFDGAGQAIVLGNIFEFGRTYEIDVAEISVVDSSKRNMRFFTLSEENGANSNVGGVLFRGASNKWMMYSNEGGGWSSVGFDALGDRNGISGKTIKICVSNDGTTEVFADGVSVGVSSVKFGTTTKFLEIGSTLQNESYSSGDPEAYGALLYNCTITGMRIYNGVR